MERPRALTQTIWTGLAKHVFAVYCVNETGLAELVAEKSAFWGWRTELRLSVTGLFGPRVSIHEK